MKKKWILFGILTGIFLILWICVENGAITIIDNTIYSWIGKIQNETCTNILKIVTTMGGITSLFFITFITIIVLAILNKKKYSLAIVCNLMFSTVSYIIIKNIIQRPRPIIEERLIEETGYSFPSGHTTNNVAFYIFAIYLVNTQIKNKVVKRILSICFSIIPIVIGFSRIYLRVHYPSDVIAGFCLGEICSILFISFIYKKIIKFNDN